MAIAPTEDSFRTFCRPAGLPGLSARQPVDVSGSGDQGAEVGLPRAPVQLGAQPQRNGCLGEQSDPAGEERDQILAQVGSEIEDVLSFQKERALLREEQRKPGEVGAPGVDLGFGEVGVGRERGQQVGADPLGDIQ